jgi:hypothetical protein
MLEGSNRSRVTGIAPNSARDLFEAGLNEAAFVEHCLWALDQRDDGAIMSPRPHSGSIANKIPAIDRSNHRVVGDELLLVAEVDRWKFDRGTLDMRVIIPTRSVGRRDGIGSGGRRVRSVMRYRSVVAGVAVTAIAATDRSQPSSRRTRGTDRCDDR